MKTRFWVGLLLAVLCLGAFPDDSHAIVALESGMYYEEDLSYYYESDYYYFYAVTNDTVIIRMSIISEEIPTSYGNTMVKVTCQETGALVYSNNWFASGETVLKLNERSWYEIHYYENLPYPYSYSYRTSIIRMPGYPLSTQDPDVGPIEQGQYLSGIVLAGDLDAAFFPVTNPCTIQVRMGQTDPYMVPDMDVYDCFGDIVESDFPPEYRSEITSAVTNRGIYTAVLNNYAGGPATYEVSMLRIPPDRSMQGLADTDIGPIVPGETLYGEVKVPGDLDMGWFAAVSGDVVKVTMTKLVSDFNPRLELFDPSGKRLRVTNDWFQTAAEITLKCDTDGYHYAVCKDTEDRYGAYTLNVELLGGPSTNNIPDPPTGILASDGTYTNSIYVSWNPSAGALNYEVWRNYGTNDVTQITTTTNQTYFNDDTAPSNTLCYYKVKAKNSYGTSGLSTNDSGYYGIVLTGADRQAFMVGLDAYAPAYGVSALDGCSNDVTITQNTILLGDESNRWEEANLRTLFNSQATKSVVRSFLQAAAAATGPGNIVFYSQSSHGGTSGGYDTYLCMYDEGYTDAELASDLSYFDEDTYVVLMIDACYSGGLFKDANGKPYWPFAENVMNHYKQIKTSQLQAKGKAVPKDLGENIAFMTAADYNQTCWGYPFNGTYYGVFTYYMAQACTNASADVNGDREFTFAELFDYASVRASALNPDQTAQVYNRDLLESIIVRSAPEPGAEEVTSRSRAPNDYDGDGASDLAVYDQNTGKWYIYSLTKGVLVWDTNFGGQGFIPIAGDYDGNGTTELAVYQLATGNWYIYSLQNGLLSWGYNWGGGSFVPVIGDYDGDTRYDFSVYDKNTGYWYINSFTNNVILWGDSWTGGGLEAVPGDFDSDRIADIATYHTDTGFWFIRPINEEKENIAWGVSHDVTGYAPISGDFNGNGKGDLATYNWNTGNWNVWSLDGVSVVSDVQWGGPGFIPVPGDYNNDGKTDLAVYQEATGAWYIKDASDDSIILWSFAFGGPGMIPVRLNY